MIYQHSDLDRQREIAETLDTRVQAHRKAVQERSGADLVQAA
ncbi:hypothetical protein [Kitasatospora sp. DSM 101779]|nr:hypothetical protein [Kitasatospora sp. DSM 101779]